MGHFRGSDMPRYPWSSCICICVFQCKTFPFRPSLCCNSFTHYGIQIFVSVFVFVFIKCKTFLFRPLLLLLLLLLKLFDPLWNSDFQVRQHLLALTPCELFFGTIRLKQSSLYVFVIIFAYVSVFVFVFIFVSVFLFVSAVVSVFVFYGRWVEMA